MDESLPPNGRSIDQTDLAGGRIRRTYREPWPPAPKLDDGESLQKATIFRRIAEHDQTAIKAFIDEYGDSLWSLTIKFTDSQKEAEIVVQEIFHDIWSFAARHRTETLERKTIALIASNRLKKHLFASTQYPPDERINKGGGRTP